MNTDLYKGGIRYGEFRSEDNNRAQLKDLFKNRVLEPYVDSLFDFFRDELLTRYRISVVRTVKKNIVRRLENCYGLAIMLQDLSHGDIKWQNFTVHNPIVAGGLYYHVEGLLYDELQEPWDKMDRLRDKEGGHVSRELWDKWAKSLAWLPQRETIKHDEDDNIPAEEMQEVIDLIKSCLDDAREYVVFSENNAIDAIITKAKDLGVKMCNASYRELYDLLVFFDLIPRDQVDYHIKTPSRYVRENYIKAKANRLGLI